MLSQIFTPRGFLIGGGVVLVVLALVGYSGVTNGYEFFYLDSGENIVHLVLGVVALGVVFGIKNPQLWRWLTIAVAALALVATLYSLLGPTGGKFTQGTGFASANAGFTNLENPADTILHLVVTAWALVAAFWKQPAAAPQMMAQR